jgi:hypothetical protein
MLAAKHEFPAGVRAVRYGGPDTLYRDSGALGRTASRAGAGPETITGGESCATGPRAACAVAGLWLNSCVLATTARTVATSLLTRIFLDGHDRGGTMILIELDTGNEELFKSSEELAAAIRRGTIGPKSRIYHRGSARWLPITVHPEYRKAAAERRSEPQPPLKRKQWTFLGTSRQDEQLDPDSSSSSESSPGSSEAIEMSEKSSRPGWRRALGKAFGRFRSPKAT